MTKHVSEISSYLTDYFTKSAIVNMMHQAKFHKHESFEDENGELIMEKPSLSCGNKEKV